MSTEDTGATVAEPTNTATILYTNEEPEKQAATADAGKTEEVKADSTEEKPEKSAEQKELEYLRRKATKADRNNARMHQELQELRARQPQEGKAPDPVNEATQIAKAMRVADKSNDVAKDGQKRFAAAWDSALQTVIAEAGPLIQQGSMLPTALGDAILDSDDPAALLHHLGTNPHLADELSDLTPAQLGRRIERIEASMKPPAKQTTKAPAPVNPLNGNSSGANVDLEKADFATYERERAKSNPPWMRR